MNLKRFSKKKNRPYLDGLYTKNIHVRLDTYCFAKVEQKSKELRTTKGELVRMAIDEFLDNLE